MIAAPTTAPLFDLPPISAERKARERRLRLGALANGLDAELDECIALADANRDAEPDVAAYFERRACRCADRLAAVRRMMEAER